MNLENREDYINVSMQFSMKMLNLSLIPEYRNEVIVMVLLMGCEDKSDVYGYLLANKSKLKYIRTISSNKEKLLNQALINLDREGVIKYDRENKKVELNMIVHESDLEK